MSTLTKKFCPIEDDLSMAYVDGGDKNKLMTLVFLHGNPTSSYLWRNIMPQLAHHGRVIAPDLIGMGDSDKLSNIDGESYRFFQHAEFLDKFLLDCVEATENVVLVLHDWGSGLGFWWAYRNPNAVVGIAFFESLLTVPSFSELDAGFQDVFVNVRTPGVGEELILNQNLFVEVLLPGAILRNLTDEELDDYRRPFVAPGNDRLPTLVWPREVPFDGEPEDVAEAIATYSQWMGDNNIPKLYIDVVPGTFLSNQDSLVATWNNVSTASVSGIHFAQEDSPDEIAAAVDSFVTNKVAVASTTSGYGSLHAGLLVDIIAVLLTFRTLTKFY